MGPTKTARAQRVKSAPQLIGISEAAERCDVTDKTIRRWIQAGRLKAVRVGPRLLKINAADIDAMLNPLSGGAA